ncbi:MAG: hypothetical protein N3A38_14360, partial [Planctomycetota bacterium]|nr:hypothetical protein [Planctomycetota bacterium]
MADISPELMEILRCPRCVAPEVKAPAGGGKGRLRREGGRLVCLQCGRRYAIKDGIPDMIIEHAEPPAGMG